MTRDDAKGKEQRAKGAMPEEVLGMGLTFVSYSIRTLFVRKKKPLPARMQERG